MSKQNRKHCLQALLSGRAVSMDVSSGRKHVHVRTDARTYVDGLNLSSYLSLGNARRGADEFPSFMVRISRPASASRGHKEAVDA